MTKKCDVCGKPFNGPGRMGPTCAEHLGELGKYYVKMTGSPNPNEYISLVELCDIAGDFGKTRYWMVKLTGGDGGVKPPRAPEFTIYDFGPMKKYCKRAAIPSVREFAKLE